MSLEDFECLWQADVVISHLELLNFFSKRGAPVGMCAHTHTMLILLKQ